METAGQLRHPSPSSPVSLLKVCVNTFIPGSLIPAHPHSLQKHWQAPQMGADLGISVVHGQPWSRGAHSLTQDLPARLPELIVPSI